MPDSQNQMQLVDWLDDICVRFIINLPREELESVERIIFQIEEGHWYYEDFIRPLDPTLPSINLKYFCSLIFQQCPLLAGFSHFHTIAYAEFSAYKTRVPVRGAILLNHDMDHVVLVKGWKKSAKWSFPRGKINKDERDFDCAIREVYEETGYNVRTAGLANDEKNTKYIDVTLREQQMRLYVFRGVPMDTYFEPQTRKEISKIDWYSITDLPGGKSKRQAMMEDPKKASPFYMVAPFILPLKLWIKAQRKRDRLQAGLNAPEVVLVEDSGMGTDMEAMAPEVAETNEAEARHFQSLLSRLNTSQHIYNQPELPANNGMNHTEELAAQLKKLLSVGSSDLPTSTTSSNVQSVAPAPIAGGSLMSLLRPASSTVSVPPQTPFEQVDSSPPEARTPYQQQVRHPNFEGMPPPPNFPFTANAGYASRNAPPNYANTSAPYHHHPSPMQHHYQPSPGSRRHPVEVPGQSAAPDIPEGSTPHSQLFHPRGLPSSSPNALAHSHGGPPPSSLPMPKLNAHSLSLLNAFNASPRHNAPNVVSPPQQSHSMELPSQNVELQAPAAAPNSLLGMLRSQQQNLDSAPRTESEGAKIAVSQPRNPQANTLLSLFRSPGGPFPSEVGSAGRPAELAPPVAELSAGTPYHVVGPGTAMTQELNGTTTATANQPARKAKLTSATVSGPLNSPDFETVVRNRPPAELGNGAEKAPTPVPVHAIEPDMPLEAPRAIHHTTILQRRMTPNAMPAPNPAPAVAQMPFSQLPASFDRRDTLPADQKSTLMSLFGRAPNPMPSGTQPTSVPHVGGIALPLGHHRRPSQNSPVSPLPNHRLPVRQPSYHAYDSPAQNLPPVAAAIPRSRVSSFADEGANRASASPKTPITPVEKKFLFQYLEGVVNQQGQK